jgi:hypothetical protein
MFLWTSVPTAEIVLRVYEELCLAIRHIDSHSPIGSSTAHLDFLVADSVAHLGFSIASSVAHLNFTI